MGSWKEEVAPFFHEAKRQILAEANKQKIKGHWGAVGDGREEILKRFLNPFLPPTHRLSKSVIYDSQGNERSPEFDLVLSNLSWSESVLAEEKKPVFVENVVAVFEVKTDVDKAAIEEFDGNLSKLSNLVRVFHHTAVSYPLFRVPSHQQEPLLVGALSHGPQHRPVAPIRTAIFGYAGVGENTLLQHLNDMTNKLDLAIILNVGAYGYDHEKREFIKMIPEALHGEFELAALALMVSDWINWSTDDRMFLRGHLEDYL